MIERAAVAVASLLFCAIFGAWTMHGYMAPRVAEANARAAGLEDKLREQSKAVQALHDEAARREVEAAARVAAAEASAQQAQRDANRILSLPLPKGADECMAARALISRELRK